jgi:hypothetical protein
MLKALGCYVETVSVFFDLSTSQRTQFVPVLRKSNGKDFHKSALVLV